MMFLFIAGIGLLLHKIIIKPSLKFGRTFPTEKMAAASSETSPRSGEKPFTTWPTKAEEPFTPQVKSVVQNRVHNRQT